MSSKRPFRLTLKSKSVDTESNRTNQGSTYVHPLAGQQDLLRQQYSKQTEPGPSRSFSSSSDAQSSEAQQKVIEEEQEKIPTRDFETLSATDDWFGSQAADDESVRSSPIEAEFEGKSSLYTSLHDIFHQQQEQQKQGLSSSGFAVIRQANQPTSPSVSAENRQAELLQMAKENQSALLSSPAREGGILKRLRRISKKERSSRASQDSALLDQEPVSLFAEDKEQYPPPLLSQFGDRRDSETDPMLMLREAATEKTPRLERPSRERVQSMQPSLVDDDESIIDLAEFGEDDSLEESPTSLDFQSEHGHIGFADESDDEDDQESTFGAIPGSFFIDRKSDDRLGYLSPSAPSEFDNSFDSQLLDVEPSTPAETAFHEATRSEYSAALSRQPSTYSGLRERLAGGQLDEEEEEEAITPRAGADEGRQSYFETAPLGTPHTSTAQSVSSFASASTPTKSVPVKTYTWYQDQAANFSPQQRYYFLRHVLSRELVWEFERLFLVSSSASLYRPSSKLSLPRTDLGYFKTEAKGVTPDLPLMRFLFTFVLSTCPLFGPSQPIEGAAAIRARKAGARKFLDEALLPFLRFQQQAGLSQSVDLHGEWPSEVFDSPSTMGVIFGSTFRALTRLLVALLPDQRSQACSWSAAMTPSSAAYLRHRVAPSKLKQGGMEVNVVGSRLRAASKDCELLLSVRKFGFPHHYVVRTESDFYEFARGLAGELGRRTRIRPVPPPIGQEQFASSSTLIDDSVTAADRSNNGSPRKIIPSELFYAKKNSSQNSLPSLASPNRPKPARIGSSESLTKLKGSNRSSASFGSNSSSRPSNEQQGTLQSGQAVTSPSRPTTTEKSRFFYRSKTTSSTDVNTVNSKSSLSSAYNSAVPLTRDDEARRKQLRAWLRDALSVRGAGHANETKGFLDTGSFLEKEVRAATKKDIQYRADIDIKMMQERETNASNAPDEIIELQGEIRALWHDCVEGDGLLRAFEAVKLHDTFSALPLPYQRVISWTNLQVAQFIHHVFLNSCEARSNFERATELLQCIPWKMISVALREPTGLMIQRIKSSLSQEFIIKKILALHLEDVPTKKVDLEISSLRKRLGSTIMRKLEEYVASAEWQKRVIRKASKRNNIPLVAAIVRGDNKPLLAADGIKRIITATKVYQDFINTVPSFEERRAKQRVNVEVRLICDMQRALRLLSLRRNGEKVRNALTQELQGPLQAFLEPLFSLLKRLHRSKVLTRYSGGTGDVVVELQGFVFKLMDVIAGLKMRIQDPWRSLSTLTLFLDDVVPSWYRFLHQFANVDNLLLDLTLWLKDITSHLKDSRQQQQRNQDSTTSSYSSISMNDIAKFWQPPKGGVNQSDLASINELIVAGKNKRTRQMEAACRWAAGDIDADHSIQLVGEGGKTRVTPYHLSQEPFSIPPPKVEGLDVYLTGLRSALGHFM